MVPTDSYIVKKISNTIINFSNGQILYGNSKTKLTISKTNIQIHLISPLQFEEGFGFNPNSVKLVLLNGFYSHMYIKTIDYEEILSMCWRLREKSCFVMINDQIKNPLTDIFDKEKALILKLCSDIKINYN